MKKLIMLAAGATLSLPGASLAQDNENLGASSIRPMQVTCDQLQQASEEERDTIAFFILGYREGSMGASVGGASTADTGAGGTDTQTTGATTGTGSAQTGGTASGSASTGTASTGTTTQAPAASGTTTGTSATT